MASSRDRAAELRAWPPTFHPRHDACFMYDPVEGVVRCGGMAPTAHVKITGYTDGAAVARLAPRSGERSRAESRWRSICGRDNSCISRRAGDGRRDAVDQHPNPSRRACGCDCRASAVISSVGRGREVAHGSRVGHSALHDVAAATTAIADSTSSGQLTRQAKPDTSAAPKPAYKPARLDAGYDDQGSADGLDQAATRHRDDEGKRRHERRHRRHQQPHRRRGPTGSLTLRRAHAPST